MKLLPFTIEVCQLGKKISAKSLAIGATCIYCGEVATALDHFRRPYSYDNVGRRKNNHYKETETVPACTSCNSFLGSKCLPTIGLRAAYLYEWMLKRHGKTVGETLRGKPIHIRRIAYRLRHLREVACSSTDPCGEFFVLLAELEAKNVRLAKRIRRLASELILQKRIADHFDSSDAALSLGYSTHKYEEERVG